MEPSLAFAGYVISSLAFGLLSALIAFAPKPNNQSRWLFLTTIASFCWSTLAAFQLHFDFSITIVLAFESARNLFCLFFLWLSLNEQSSLSALLRKRRVYLGISCFLALVTILELSYVYISLLNGFSFLILHMLTSVTVLYYVEQFFRGTDSSARWTIKPLCFAFAIIFLTDFVMYADSVLTKSLAFDIWAARGWLIWMAAPLILLSARRAKSWAIRVYVSRDVIFHSSLLVGAGLYLMVMAFAGFYLRQAGSNWGGLAQYLVYAFGGAILVALIMSQGLRRGLKVQIAKHFFANKYEYREEWMRFARILSSSDESPYHRALTALQQPFAAKHAALVVFESSGPKLKAKYHVTDEGLSPIEVASLVGPIALEHDWIVDFHQGDMGGDSMPFVLSPDVQQQLLNSPFRYCVPIVREGVVQAVCLLSKPSSTVEVNWEDRDLMQAIANQLAVYLSLELSQKRLAESQQFEAFNQMSAFLVHDLKNVLAQLQLLSKNSIKHKHNPEFIDDAFETVDSASARLNKVLGQLRNKQISSRNSQYTSLNQLLNQAVEERTSQQPLPTVKLEQDIQVEIKVEASRFVSVIGHVIQNAQDACDKNGTVNVSSWKNDKFCGVIIKDNGTGMDAEFVEKRLFKPFDTTKGNAGMGIGAYDAKKLAEQHGGWVDVKSSIGEGTEFVLAIQIS
ncbi:PEP-CTERM system histidine kinase PrsK [Alginatibacterium sediminis]|uniref:histidine kinase n=1 Tax=Alginatibacterium sediminis TaxID=2164068 RepID=A0A420E7E9_9ALTE|nr:XrtA/PEP-CTERM system histidine kinase PrsK [Alginatibacterium sediminis]RKF14404.1 PEP-CTERM system histidine kinase PrsK [Alginatibacterium sediminis]